jgi:Flp pilus assembly protein TadD
MNLLMKALDQTIAASTPATRPESSRSARTSAAFAAHRCMADVLAWFRDNPIGTLAAVAVLGGVAFGIHAYLEIAEPSLLVRQDPPQSQHAPVATSVTHAAPPELSAPQHAQSGIEDIAGAKDARSTSAASDATGVPLAEASRQPESRAPDVKAEGFPVQEAHARSPGLTRNTLIPTSTVVAAPARVDGTETRTSPEPEAERRSTRKRSAERAAPPPPQEGARTDARERIAVSPAAKESRVHPHVAEGYALLQAGNLDPARTMYSRALEAEPLNIDALLGLAYVAARENRSDEAMRTYLRILQVNPRHAVSQAALIGLMGRADPTASETRLKQLLSREPSAFLHFVLGNLYGEQGSWSQAQQSYFQAHHLEPENPDYAYNLAVGLDHLGQTSLALQFYRRAEQLASAQGRANFDPAHARRRIGTLSSRPEQP